MNISNPTERQRDVESIFHDSHIAITDTLAREGFVTEVMTESEIKHKIQLYLSEHRDDILEFLGEDGKILVPMNSAEKFADIVIDTLAIANERVTKFKVSTYKAGVSMKQQLRDEDKQDLAKKLDIKQGDKVFILEDLIDTGHTLRVIYDFLFNHMVDVRALCLLDKHVEEGEKVKKEMGSKLNSIIDIGQDFVIGFGMDYEERLCADIPGLWKIREEYKTEVLRVLNTFVGRLKDIIEGPNVS